MWEWSRTVAERAAAAAWTSWRTREPRPTVLDPEYWEDSGVRGETRGGETSSARIGIADLRLAG